MSDLHRSALNRAKKAKATFMPSLPESENTEPTLRELIEDEKKKNLIPDKEDEEILSKHESFKSSLFPIIEAYTHNSVFFKTYFRPPKGGPIFILIHGAGSSALTYGKLAQELIKQDDTVGIFTFTLRGHEKFDETLDYSLNSFVEDFDHILSSFIATNGIDSPLYLVGHSLGGAILSKFVSTVKSTYNIQGITMLDIVEETAIHSLLTMPLFISKRPKNFSSFSKAIAWFMISLLNNEDSANISVPDILNKDLTWKIDLLILSKFWDTWFVNLSKNFLSFTGPKLLVLSTHETLDKELIIGQMQGKYQLVVFNNNSKVGHFVQEDLPHQLSICLLDFMKRNGSPTKYMAQELGIKPTWGGKINK